MKKVARLRTSPIMSDDQRQQNVSNEPVVVRTTGRIKKPKAVFDPSDNYLPRAQRLPVPISSSSSGFNSVSLTQESRSTLSRMSTASSDNSSVAKEVCVVCGKRESKRTSFAIKNPLLSCLDCEGKIHRMCLKAEYDDFEHVRQSYRCDNCTPCAVCQKINGTSTVDENETLVCTKCTKVYHIQCLQHYSVKQDDDTFSNWKCPKCKLHSDTTDDEDLPVKRIREIIGDHTSPIAFTQKSTSNASRPSSTTSGNNSAETVKTNTDDYHTGNGSTNDKNFDVEQQNQFIPNCTSNPKSNNPNDNQYFNDIPDVHDWSVDQVFEYFSNNFPKEAHVFKDQEIDGRSLLLLKRSDVVKKLPLKLGPSLRIYSAILKIQGQQNDPTLGWNCSV